MKTPGRSPLYQVDAPLIKVSIEEVISAHQEFLCKISWISSDSFRTELPEPVIFGELGESEKVSNVTSFPKSVGAPFSSTAWLDSSVQRGTR